MWGACASGVIRGGGVSWGGASAPALSRRSGRASHAASGATARGWRSSAPCDRRQRRRHVSGDRHGADGLHGAPQHEQLRQGSPRSGDAPPRAGGQRLLSRDPELLRGASSRHGAERRSAPRARAVAPVARSRRSSISGCDARVGRSPSTRLGVRRLDRNVTVFAHQEGRFGAYALPDDGRRPATPITWSTARSSTSRRQARTTVPLSRPLPAPAELLAFDPDSTLLARILAPVIVRRSPSRSSRASHCSRPAVRRSRRTISLPRSDADALLDAGRWTEAEDLLYAQLAPARVIRSRARGSAGISPCGGAPSRPRAHRGGRRVRARRDDRARARHAHPRADRLARPRGIVGA